MKDCEQVRVELPLYISSEASPETSSFVERHLETCPECRTELEDLRAAAALVSRSPAELAPPDHLERLTFDLIEKEAVQDAPARGDTMAAPVPMPAPVSTSRGRVASRRRIRIRTPRSRPRSHERPRLAAMLAPGIAAAMVVLGLVGVRLDQDNHDLRRRISEQEAAVGSVGEKMDTVTLTRAEDPEMRLVADIYRDDGDNYQLVLDAHDFPPTPNGFQFELWFAGKEGWVSAGAFKTTGEEKMTFRLHTALDPSKFPAMDLTLEPIDGDPGRTGPAVMHAPIPGDAL